LGLGCILACSGRPVPGWHWSGLPGVGRSLPGICYLS